MCDLRKIFVLLAVVLLCAGAVFSQAVSATLLGTVKDATGAVVPNAKVTLTESNTGIAHTVPSNESGNYEFVNIPPGTYQVAVEMPGFKKEVRQNIVVVVDSTVRVDVQLQTGDVTQTVEVSASAPALKTDRADVTTTVDNEQMEDLPIGENRNYQNLLTLVPGTTDPTFQHSQFFNSASSIQMNTNGQFTWPTITRWKASIITSAPGCCRFWFLRLKPSSR